MTDTQSQTRDALEGSETFDVLSPGTGEVVGTWPVHDAAHVQATTDAAGSPRSGGRG